jgi:hypothetical protein
VHHGPSCTACRVFLGLVFSLAILDPQHTPGILEASALYSFTTSRCCVPVLKSNVLVLSCSCFGPEKPGTPQPRFCVSAKGSLPSRKKSWKFLRRLCGEGDSDRVFGPLCRSVAASPSLNAGLTQDLPGELPIRSAQTEPSPMACQHARSRRP